MAVHGFVISPAGGKWIKRFLHREGGGVHLDIAARLPHFIYPLSG